MLFNGSWCDGDCEILEAAITWHVKYHIWGDTRGKFPLVLLPSPLVVKIVNKFNELYQNNLGPKPMK
jgi:hypothetical protein